MYPDPCANELRSTGSPDVQSGEKTRHFIAVEIINVAEPFHADSLDKKKSDRSAANPVAETIAQNGVTDGRHVSPTAL